MKKKRLAWIAVIFTICMGAVYWLWPSNPDEAVSANPMDRLQKLTDSITNAPIREAPSVASTNHPQELDTAIALSKEYQSARDMHGLYAKYRHSDNPDEKYFAWRAIEFCSRFLMPSKRDTFVAAPEKLWNSTPDRDLVEHNLFARCSEFKEFTSNKDFRTEVRNLEDELKESNSKIILAGKSSDLLTQGKKDEANAIARQVLLSKEPDAIASLENYLKESRNEQRKLLPGYKPGQAQPTDTSAIALELAACDLGKDCSKDSEEAQSICTWGGPCDESLADQKLKPLTQAEADEVRRKKDQYVNAIRNGDLSAFGL